MKIFTIILLIALAITGITVGFVFNYFTPEVPDDTTHEHVFGEWEVKAPASCVSVGEEIRMCDCGEEETRIIEKLGHSYGEWETKTSVSCTNDGEEIRKCACGAEESRTVESSGHSYGEWETKTSVSCTNDGEEIRKCACGAEESRTVESSGHSYGEWETKSEADCDSAEVECRKCACGAEEIRDGDDAATGHTAVSITAACIKTDAMKYDVLTAADFAVIATCNKCGEYTVTEGITLENATLSNEGENIVTVKLGELSSDVTVTVAKFNKVVNGTIVDDTYVNAGSKDGTYGDRDELPIYNKSSYRVLFRFNFTDVLNSQYYAEFGKEAIVRFTFTVTNDVDMTGLPVTFKAFPATEIRSSANFDELCWTNYNNDYTLGWGDSNSPVNLLDSEEIGNRASYADGKLVITVTLRELDGCIDEKGNVIFVLLTPQNTLKPKIASKENTNYAGPSVEVIFSDDHAHAYTEKIAEEKYLASANCEEKAKYYVSCSCGEIGTATFEYGEVIEHSFGEWETKTPSNCTDAEVEYRTCSCGKEETREGDAALGHDMKTKYDESYHWTECDREGCEEKTDTVAHYGGEATETEQATCEGCGQKYGATLSHVHSYTATVTDPTCTAKGYITYTCECNDSYIDEDSYVDAKGHSWELTWDENNHWNKCSVCEGTDAVTAHFGGEATETEQATCEGCGQKYGELKEAETTECTIDGAVVDDTFILSSGKNSDKSGNEKLYLYSSTHRSFIIVNFADILNSEDFESVKENGKFRITFTISGNESDVENTKFILQIANPTYTDADGNTQYTASIPANGITWTSAHTSAGAYYNALYLGNMNYIVGSSDSGALLADTDKVIYNAGADGDAGTITYELTYDDIKDYICMDQDSEYYGQAVFKLRGKGSATKATETLYYASNDSSTPPTVKFVYEK